MTSKFSLLTVIVASLLATSIAPVSAMEPPVKLLGDPAPASSGTRTIVITPDTRHVNVTGGEVVNFAVGDKMFTWSFFVAAGISSFDLNRIAPPGMLDHVVTAYVARDPRYIGGGNRNR
ncbi:hypothetical protein D3870_13390 [Noviherbaspirillum cavernae]|uniref:CzcE family metal-binding protein n=1 Tax=Noviherbaspirillum cavernae TaxID=2320862 RepID=A0A418X6F7_9BURK|nr:CzcE family metal-binding protein [Noviherbaspirillum cavernae]RJG08064.1 hypothetical protein D3870_13390 [Noviherbaspirillum cavernae]